MLLLMHGFSISFPSQRGHVQRNLVYNPENAKEMVIRQCAEEPLSRKIVPTWPNGSGSREEMSRLGAQSRRRQDSSASVESNHCTLKKSHKFARLVRDRGAHQPPIPDPEAHPQSAGKMSQSKCISHCQLNAALPS
jgi:hypothetical protein